MEQQPSELKKLAAIATDFEVPAKLRAGAMETLGKMGTHEALLILLGIAGNDKLTRQERDLALKQARVIVKSGR